MPVGSTMIESLDTSAGTVSSVQEAYQCRNAECEAFTEAYVWTFNGESFILHRMERPLEAA
jgi:hypothetical protein